jgi:hypothetical protein
MVAPPFLHNDRLRSIAARLAMRGLFLSADQDVLC